MIHSDVEKGNMPDGSALLPEAVHADVTLPSINGEQGSPLDPPESPEDKGIIRCICGFEEDDGFTIFCDRCSVWQHGACVGIYDEKDAPDKYLCDQCNPRPLDVSKAILHQSRRLEADREAEQNNHRPRRRSSNHPKTKPNHQNANLAPGPNLAPPQGRKEKHPSPPRRTEGKRPRAAARGQSASQVETIVPEDVDVVNDDEADIPFWPDAEDFLHGDTNELSPEMAQLLERRLQQLDLINIDGDSSLISTLIEGLPRDIERLHSIRDYIHKTLRQPISKKGTPDSSNFVRQFGLFAAEPMSENDLILEFIGQIGIQPDYKNNPINQFSTLQRPKPYVLFSPPNTIDVYVDARQYGNDARYVRRSCFPNARVALVTVSNGDERGIHFGLFATRNIKTRDEITIGHEWNRSHKVEEMIASVRDETRPLSDVYTPEMIRSMVTYASTILINADCACYDDRCIFVRLQKALAGLPDGIFRRSSGEDADVMSVDGLQRSDDLDGSDIDEDSRPNSRGTQKPVSRDRTPSKDMTLESRQAKTSREQRKIDQAMAQFARMEEKKEKSGRKKPVDAMDIDEQSTAGKRRRQLSVTSESQTRPPAQRNTSTKGRGVKRKSLSPSPGADRVSESGASLNELSPKPAGRVPNRVKRTMKGRKEPSSKKVRLQPPDQDEESTLPKWIKKTTLSESWTPPQLLWFKKYAENAKREFEQTLKECRQDIPTAETPTELVAPIEAVRVASPQPIETITVKETPNLRVAVPSPSLPSPISEQTPVTAAASQTGISYFPQIASGASPLTSGLPQPSPVGTPSTPKIKLSLADYRARRASGMVTPSVSTIPDPMQAVGDDFTAPPPPPQGPNSPDQKLAGQTPSTSQT